MRQRHHDVLAAYLPVNAVSAVSRILNDHRIHLHITSERRSKLGDYRPAVNGRQHRISVNGNLTSQEFLLVFLHELAHLLVYKRYGRGVRPHGGEWKATYGQLIRDFVRKDCFHHSLDGILTDYSFQVKGAGVASMEVGKVLRELGGDRPDEDWRYLDELPAEALFETRDGRIFVKEHKLRTRYRCRCVKTRRPYLIHASAKVRSRQKEEKESA